jgi:hypothetical protein
VRLPNLIVSKHLHHQPKAPQLFCPLATNTVNNNNMAATYDIVPIGETDASVLTRIGYKAFADDLLNKRLYNLEDATPAQIEQDLQWRISRNEKRMYGAGSHWFKAVERSTGKAVGYCGILAPEKGKPKGLDADDTKMPETMNQELWAVIGAKGKELREKHVGKRDDYWCKSITISVQSRLTHTHKC